MVLCWFFFRRWGHCFCQVGYVNASRYCCGCWRSEKECGKW